MTELTKLSVTEMKVGLHEKSFSSVDLTKAHLKRINDTNASLNSFLLISEDVALAQAEAADKALAKGEDKLLLGIPVALKDILVTEGIETSVASKMLKGFIPPYQGTAVKKLCDAGAVILGKTNMDEFAMGASNENSAFGAVKNPWNETRVPGGSSGGSAAAVSSGQAPIALGTDTGGSIRQPAGFVGIVGMKPTYGRVSRYGVVAFASSLDQVGPFARNVDDLALALEAISGHDPLDSTSMNEAVPAFSKEVANASDSLAGVRVGVPRAFIVEGINSDIEKNFNESLECLKSLGAELVDIELPHAKHSLPAYYIINPAEASSNLARYDGVRYGTRAPDATDLGQMYAKTRANGFGPEVKRRILIGTYVLSAGYYDAYYRKAQQVRTLIIQDFNQAFGSECDVIVTPTSPTDAFPIGDRANDPLQMYLADVFTVPVNLAGLPGLSIPSGLSADGLPIGLQIIGAPFNELGILKVAKAFETASAFDATACIQ